MEHDEQVYLMRRAKALEETYPELRWLFAIPNGGLRNFKVAAKLKAEGVKAGVWDLFLPVPRGKFCGLFIEMKFGDNKLTSEQKEFQSFIQGQGYKDFVAYDAVEAEEYLKLYLSMEA